MQSLTKIQANLLNTKYRKLRIHIHQWTVKLQEKMVILMKIIIRHKIYLSQFQLDAQLTTIQELRFIRMILKELEIPLRLHWLFWLKKFLDNQKITKMLSSLNNRRKNKLVWLLNLISHQRERQCLQLYQDTKMKKTFCWKELQIESCKSVLNIWVSKVKNKWQKVIKIRFWIIFKQSLHKVLDV